MGPSSKETTSSNKLRCSRLPQIGKFSLLLSLATRATAFHSASPEPLAMLKRRDLRSTSTYFYRITNRPQKAPTSTHLRYRDGSEDSSSTKESVVRSNWWNGLFSSQSDTGNGQDSVDEYLEFLERRYNRLHEDNEERPFSAMNWLLNGSEKGGEIPASHQQKEDALYVLGVAGLASQKLLQKHPHLQHAKQVSDISRPPAPIAALDTIVTTAEDVTFGHLVIKSVLVPLVKVLYFVHRQKQIFLDVQLNCLKRYAVRATRRAIRSLLYAPVKITKSIIELGGGKGSVASTIALASAILVLLRPLLQGLLSEGTVSP